MKLLVATRNAKKLEELDRILKAENIDSIELLSLRDVEEYEEKPETGRTFVDNAHLKALEGARHTGLACLADDSGLSVDELNGMPGVLSARWSGAHGDDAANNKLLLAQMADCPDERRGASFRSACALVIPGVGKVPAALSDAGFPAVIDDSGNLLLFVEGRWPGKLLREPIGENGFGYDPIFAPEVGEGGNAEGTLSAAQLSAETKDAHSHRGRALRALASALKILAGLPEFA
ncbi:MAG: non-canonical purine NTP pyrophosphatase [Corynebacterium sp.]|uniref:non-canonical purine NTP pyrophosphatase n=1 Tax=Corynebacterium sp. TaxID=1720 RepID=UPI0026DABC18|nr:non-canonical purine NTP pyrophosphatase [Corynebacterium sp.]MDO5030727.1 non-canonical purine NTP pyrophosphatase [Corynebacterium sp.]